MKKYILEVCTDSVEASCTASRCGANRLELCSNLILGGTTPGTCLFQAVRKYCSTKINVLIRPRYGDFCYTDYEFEMLKEEVKLFRALGADGIVTGILKPDGNLNIEQMEEILSLADNVPVTLHRAFDVCADPYRTLEEAKRLGIRTILTSGQKNTCIDGVFLLKELIEKSAGEVDILVGGGVSAKIIPKLREATRATSYHMSGKRVEDSAMLYRKEDISMGLPSFSEYQIFRADEEEILRAVNTLQHLA